MVLIELSLLGAAVSTLSFAAVNAILRSMSSGVCSTTMLVGALLLVPRRAQHRPVKALCAEGRRGDGSSRFERHMVRISSRLARVSCEIFR